MSGNRKTRKTKGFKFFIIVGIFVLGFVYATSYVELMRARQELSGLKREIEVWKALNRELEREISYAESPEYVEKVAREELGLVKPGEIPIVVTEPQKTDIPPVKKRPGSNSQRILY